MKHKNVIFMSIVFLVGVAVNLLLSDFSGWKYLGTFFSAFLGGPVISVPVALVSSIIDTGIGTSGRWILLVGHLLVGLVAGVMVMKGFANTFWKPLVIFIVGLVIATLTIYSRSTLWLMEAQGIWSLSEIMYYFLESPMKYFVEVIKLGCNNAVPIFVSVYIAWFIPKVAATKYDFKYKDKY